jgi:CheY-like chemotaxis protein
MTGAGRPEQPRRAPRRSPRRRPLILIADDTTDTRELYADYFSRRRFTVVTAHDGAAAINVALDHVPDVIVMDLAMPQFDGLTAIRRIKSDARMRRTRIILLTGYPQKAIERGALEAGADRFLTKPCLPEDLERHVNEVRRPRRVPGRGTRSA